ncbi:MAG: hypothetical protein R3F56_12350 [Planctomycetota bacterium]
MTSNELPPWAQGADITGLSIRDASNSGKWLFQWVGPVDFGRLGARFDQNPADEQSAFAALLAAGFDDIHVPAGEYDAFLNLQVGRPLRITGAGHNKTVFRGNAAAPEWRAAFYVTSSLRLESLRFDHQPRLIWVNADASHNLGRLDVELDDVQVFVDPTFANGASVVQTGGAEPLPGTTFHLQMQDCHFSAGANMDHINARGGLMGRIGHCTFEGGKRGLVNTPSGNSNFFPGRPANDFSPDFRLVDCTFGTFTCPEPDTDSYHLQVTGTRWVISGCRFGSLVGPQSGNVYSRLQDSHIVGCTFVGGGRHQLFFKGTDRGPVGTLESNGWGNTVIGCTFEGHDDGVTQWSQVYMNVKSQRFIGCSFRNYDTYAIAANQQGATSDNLLIQSCEFSSTRSPAAIRLNNGGRNIRILDCTFAGITGTNPNVRKAVLLFDPYPLQATRVFEDVRVEGCTFQDCVGFSVWFYPAREEYAVRRFRFVGNTIGGGTEALGFAWGGKALLTGLVLEDNSIEVVDYAWAMPPGCVSRSTNNTWVWRGQNPPSPEALGVSTGTRVVRNSWASGTLAIGPDDRMLVVSAATPVTVALQTGTHDAQQVTLVGGSESGVVTIADGGNAALGAATRPLGHGDVLELVWIRAIGKWCERAYSDN